MAALDQARGSIAATIPNHLQDTCHDFDVGQDDRDLGRQRRFLLGALSIVLLKLFGDLRQLQVRETDGGLGLQDTAACLRGLRVEGGDILANLLEQGHGLAVVRATLLHLVVELGSGVVHHLVEHVSCGVQGLVFFGKALSMTLHNAQLLGLMLAIGSKGRFQEDHQLRPLFQVLAVQDEEGGFLHGHVRHDFILGENLRDGGTDFIEGRRKQGERTNSEPLHCGQHRFT
mmetsp:Transcript_154802/g.495006  ORF Transcript_154802/g.495006 Transcript_154802/m.495006 type:complete len:230 (-) Transcript_154802:31-720(-)